MYTATQLLRKAFNWEKLGVKRFIKPFPVQKWSRAVVHKSAAINACRGCLHVAAAAAAATSYYMLLLLLKMDAGGADTLQSTGITALISGSNIFFPLFCRPSYALPQPNTLPPNHTWLPFIRRTWYLCG
jgi:hypothetical protein